MEPDLRSEVSDRRSARASDTAARAGLIAFLSFSAVAQVPELERHFDYDPTAPLDVIEVGVDRRPNGVVHDLSYASPKGGRVPAYLVVPHTQGPHAAVVWGHWYWDNSPIRNRNEFLEEALALAPTGVVSLLTDGPVARPGHVKDNSPLNEQQVMIWFSRSWTCGAAPISCWREKMSTQGASATSATVTMPALAHS